MKGMTDDDIAIDVQWRQVFKQPLPMLGAPDAARAILARYTALDERRCDDPGADQEASGHTSGSWPELGGTQRRHA